MVPPGSGRIFPTFSEYPRSLGQIHRSDLSSVAKDRFWFGEDYIPFISSVRGIHDDVLEVVGIGTVKLQTKASPSETGPVSDRSLQLKHVLHVPDIYCNIIGGPALQDYDVKFRVPQDTSGSWATIINAVDGHPVAYLRPVAENVAVLRVQLSQLPFAPEFKPLLFGPCVANSIHAFWSEDERERFVCGEAPNPTQTTPIVSLTLSLSPNKVAKLEKQFHHLDELNRVQDNQDEARQILRILISDSDDEMTN